MHHSLFAHYAKWVSDYAGRVHRLRKEQGLSLGEAEIRDIANIKQDNERAIFRATDDTTLFVVECDAQVVAVSSGVRPVAYKSRNLQGSELNYRAVEKEALPMIVAVRKWSHLHPLTPTQATV